MGTKEMVKVLVFKKWESKPGAVAPACNPSYSGGKDLEDGGLRPAQAKSSWDPISTNKSWAPVISTAWRNINRRTEVQVNPGIKPDPIWKITKAKRSGVWLKWQSTCLASSRPRVQIPVSENKKKRRNIGRVKGPGNKSGLNTVLKVIKCQDQQRCDKLRVGMAKHTATTVKIIEKNAQKHYK
jgi:hypothetical protein